MKLINSTCLLFCFTIIFIATSYGADSIWVSKNINWTIDTTSQLNLKTGMRDPYLSVFSHVVFINFFSDGFYREIGTGIIKGNDSIYFDPSSCYKEYNGRWIKKNNKIIVSKKLVEQMYCLYEVGKNPDDEYNKIYTDTITISDKDEFGIIYKEETYILSKLKLSRLLQSLISYRH
jgi:hypothetical protein